MRFAKDLRPGDLIIVGYNRTLRHAIYHGKSKSGSIQFYILPYYTSDLTAWKKSQLMERLEAGKKPFKNYILGTGEDRIVKLDPAELTNTVDREAYIGMVSELKNKGIIQ